ncbi:hypothetical protein OJF2_32200 [Aquisphaera giovannonii]|uniref:Uncharacterized protein n=1 Tax=Aquisphaera giovannonii TaxID=406548 RepID=A0A5B9W354_9BACT|nr:hypothetical protein [Aquisphaera giovannonii]QEH34679.1 hypothetical protein OJF2_32200 [Aquisphaera giovannonii]
MIRRGRTAEGLAAFFEDLAARKANPASLRGGLDFRAVAGRPAAREQADAAAYGPDVRSERSRRGPRRSPRRAGREPDRPPRMMSIGSQGIGALRSP